MARFYDINEIVDDLCLLSGDIFRRNKGLYLSCAKMVYDDMNDDVMKLSKRVKIPVRRMFNVNKKTNSINIPNNWLRVNSISVVDRMGCFHPVYLNNTISDDIVDLGGAKDCSCERNCNNILCNTIKGYEAVQSVKSDFLPNGNPISFNCIDKKCVDSQGFFYSQTQYPLRVYESGVWTDTVLHTDNEKLCTVEVDPYGCVLDTELNYENVCTACGIDTMAYGGSSVAPPFCEPNADTWTYHCASVMDMFNVQCGAYPFGCRDKYSNIYNISELGDRIIFPANFGWDKVMIRFYEDITIKNMQIPYIVKPCFMTGLQYFSATNNDKKQKLAAMYEQKYTKQKWGAFLALNKYTIEESKEIFTPKVHFPSYILNHREREY